MTLASLDEARIFVRGNEDGEGVGDTFNLFLRDIMGNKQYTCAKILELILNLQRMKLSVRRECLSSDGKSRTKSSKVRHRKVRTASSPRGLLITVILRYNACPLPAPVLSFLSLVRCEHALPPVCSLKRIAAVTYSSRTSWICHGHIDR